jgi:hypothetical protein
LQSTYKLSNKNLFYNPKKAACLFTKNMIPLIPQTYYGGFNMTAALTPYLSQSEQDTLIERALERQQQSQAIEPKGSALCIMYTGSFELRFVSSCNTVEEPCSEAKVIAFAEKNFAHPVLNSKAGRALAIVTVSNKGSSVPCEKCLKIMKEKLPDNIIILAVNIAREVTIRTSLSRIM